MRKTVKAAYIPGQAGIAYILSKILLFPKVDVSKYAGSLSDWLKMYCLEKKGGRVKGKKFSSDSCAASD